MNLLNISRTNKDFQAMKLIKVPLLPFKDQVCITYVLDFIPN